MPENLSSQFVCPILKILDFNEKKIHWASVVHAWNESKWLENSQWALLCCSDESQCSRIVRNPILLLRTYFTFHKTAAKKATWWLCYILLHRICFIVKVAFFQKNQLGIGVRRGKPGEMVQNWILEPLCSEIWVIMIDITNFNLICIKSLDGRVVIAFRSN